NIFIEIIRQYSETHQITEQIKPPEDIAAPVPRSPQDNRKHRHLVIGEAYQLGKTIEQLMTDFGIKQGTVLDNLYQYHQEAHPLERDEFQSISQLTTDQRQQVFASFDRLGTDRLRPVFEALHGEIVYDEIKILRLSYLCRSGARKVEYKTFVCLATSRKYGGYCIAGKEWSDEVVGPWIRPVGEDATGELTINDVRLNNDNVPQILDMIQIPVIGPAPHSYQKENVLTVKNKGWTWRGKLPVSSLARLYDDVALLWINGYHSTNGLNDRIPEAIAGKAIDSSLYLIKPVNLVIIVSDDLDGRKKVRARFEFKGVSYLLAVTDPAIEKEYLYRDIGEYPFTAKDLYLTISLGEPFNDYCYKLVAGVIAC
ncbi:MAG: helix-turn-helix domain-containing protein, partial [Deltaproteobacteria bacterium]|nr:helix-turn-helix domain-containing protein [Deltaproteobacteria bacterium]